VQQLHGKLEVSRGSGLSATVTFRRTNVSST
jgi:hypothetical protein